MDINVLPKLTERALNVYAKKQATRLVLLVTCLIAYEKI